MPSSRWGLDWMRGWTMTLGWRGSAPLWDISMAPLWYRGMFYTQSLPPHEVRAPQSGSSSGYVGGIGILPHHSYPRLWWVMLAKGSECIWSLHLYLIMTTVGSHHSQVPFFHSISNQDSHGSSFTTNPQTSIGDKLHPSLPQNVRGYFMGEKPLILA